MTQPVSVGDWHAGMWANVPPTGSPVGTATLPPSTMAEIKRRRRAGLLSTWSRRRVISMAAP